jgi:predicted DNA-binding helix-hairpin-helix protein
MERMVETARILRVRHNFKGYIHLKILPGASLEHIREAMELSDRVSINLEATSQSHMSEMSPTKDFQNDIIQRQGYIRDLMRKVSLPAGQTTQLVVGGAGESDQEIFDRILYEYRELGIKRAYYSAFSPIKGTPFEARKKEPLWREHRLYQMDWLYRIYHFSPDEIGMAFDDQGFLSDSDPKVAIAREVLRTAVDPSCATYAELIRVPGIGPASAHKIMALRKKCQISSRNDLACLGVRIKRADPFLKINGWKGSTLDQWLS